MNNTSSYLESSVSWLSGIVRFLSSTILFVASVQLSTWSEPGMHGQSPSSTCCRPLGPIEFLEPALEGDPDSRMVTVFGFDSGRLEIAVNAGPDEHVNLREGYYESLDSGASWRFTHPPPRLDPTKEGFVSWGRSRASPMVLYRSVISSGIKGKRGPEKYERSDDGGKTWMLLAANVRGTTRQLQIISHVYDPIDPNILYSEGCVEADCSIRSPSHGIYLSEDGGQTFSLINKELSQWLTTFAVNPRNNKIIYAADANGNLVKTEDRGHSWKLVGQNNQLREGYTIIQGAARNRIDRATFTKILIDPIRPDTVYVLSTKGLLKSANSGRTWCVITWRNSEGYTVSPVSLAVNPGDNMVLFAGTVFGLFKSPDQGCTWEKVDVAKRIIN